jgi:hypothetical protein
LLETAHGPQQCGRSKRQGIFRPDAFQSLEDVGLSEALGSMVGPECLQDAVELESMLHAAEQDVESTEWDRRRRRCQTADPSDSDSGSECADTNPAPEKVVELGPSDALLPPCPPRPPPPSTCTDSNHPGYSCRSSVSHAHRISIRNCWSICGPCRWEPTDSRRRAA